MEQVVSINVMRESDKITMQQMEDPRMLMYRAGKAVYESYHWHGAVAIFCGTGNNAGDGYVLAQFLCNENIPVHLYLCEERFTPHGAYYFAQCTARNIPYSVWQGEIPTAYETVVDCLLGTGFHGEVQGRIGEMIDAINAAKHAGVSVVSVDINSGLNGENGLGSRCVCSDLTVSIGFLKRGHVLNRARDVMTRVVNCNIGIELHGSCSLYPCAKDFASLLPPRPHFSHKGNWGYVTVMGGCLTYSGAAKLANLSAAALRAGCGVVRLAVPDCIVDSVMPYLLESTLAPQRSDAHGMIRFDQTALHAAMDGTKAAAIGMGWGTGGDQEEVLRWLLTNYEQPMVIDADALNTLSFMTDGLSLVDRARGPVILTPHLKEFERLSGVTCAESQANPIDHAQAFARDHHVILLLKGTATVVTDGQETYLINRGSGGMATAGSGDVLSGILAGVLGYCPPTAKTVAMGAWIAGRAGEIAAASSNPISMVSSDTVHCIPQAVTEILSAVSKSEQLVPDQAAGIHIFSQGVDANENDKT